MSSNFGSGIRAGLFILFVALLALLAPLQTAAGIGASSRSNVAETKNSNSPVEHREKETLRERFPKVAQQGRSAKKPETPCEPLPASLQTGGDCAIPGLRMEGGPGTETKLSHEYVRGRHSPASLQVYRR